MLCSKTDAPPFQVFPIESFSLPQKFESLLKEDSHNKVPYSAITLGNSARPSLLDQFISCEPNLPEIRCNIIINLVLYEIQIILFF